MAVRIVANQPTIKVVSPVQDTIVRTEAVTTSKTLTQIYGQLPQSADRLGNKFYQDTQYTLENPLMLPAGVKTQIPDNGQGMLTMGYGASPNNWLNRTTGRFYPDAQGDCFLYRVNFTIRPTLNNRSILITFEIGTPNPVFNNREVISTGAGVAIPLSKLILSQAGPSTVANGGAIYVTPEMDCEVSRISVLVEKTYAADLR